MNLNNNNNSADAQSPTSTSPSSSGTILPTIQITSPQEGQQVPLGELTIYGISSDDKNRHCIVSADVNDVGPMQNVTAAGDSKKNNDFSKWSLKYTPEYQLIKKGENELTARITCLGEERSPNTDAFLLMSTSDPTSISGISKWHTINVTGVAGAPPVSQPTPSTENTEGLIDEADKTEESEGEAEDIDYEALSNNEENSNDDNNNEEESINEKQNDDTGDGENEDDNDEDDTNDESGGRSGERSGDSFFGGDPFFD
jgi:hypothetical protein